ncbi:MAG: NADH-quinone oxidoreductase subunit K, partial [Deltaproteobacteria bacterium]|nr:NADH-quinone oxidoreductase subunit K [Deltaproteobacteria bacterium]
MPLVTIGLQHYLILGAILFTLGLYTVLTRRNAISILMGVELILNSANINYV